jgi:hypothetical protein
MHSDVSLGLAALLLGLRKSPLRVVNLKQWVREMPEIVPTKKPSTLTWFIINVFYPLLPFFLEGIIRLTVEDFRLDFDTFSGSTLSISLGLLCLFVNQSLLTDERPLSDASERDSIRTAATFFSSFAVASFAFFAVLVLLHALLERSPASADLKHVNDTFEAVVFVGCVIPVVAAVVAQKSFKLRTIW